MIGDRVDRRLEGSPDRDQAQPEVKEMLPLEVGHASSKPGVAQIQGHEAQVDGRVKRPTHPAHSRLPRFITLGAMHPVAALFRRNAWATDRLLEFGDGRPEAAVAADGDVYGSIDALFNHIVSSEAGYLRLVTGKLPKDRVLLSEPRPLGDLRQ